MAYNLQSLIQILEQILHPNQQKLSFNHEKREQLKSLLVKATSLEANLEKFPPLIRKRIHNTETQIRDAAFEAEDIIESDVVDQILVNPGRERLMISPPDLQHIIIKLDCAIDKVMEIGGQTVKSSFPQVSFVPNPESKTPVVGLDKDLDQVKEKLIRPGLHAKLEVITIVGMGGIGKTALARQLYNHPHVFSHFDHCAWVTISQEYNRKVILVGLVSCLTRENVNELLRHDESELGVILHKILYNSRYLIVLDDIWTTTVWEDIRMFFPENKTRSRIVVTTRDLHVANRANSLSPHHHMHLLDEFESWELLCGKAFGNENCPPALESIGKRIAKNCRGLPLVIQVLGGFLSKAQKEEDLWEHVACDVSSVVTDDVEHFSRILALSYDHLPQHLRPCFLHFGAFPEDHEIKASRLMRLWVAEGFLQPIDEKTMEEAAEVYLKALVNRNLLDISKRGSNGKVKSYVIHDMLRDLCIQKASEEKFLYVMNQKVHEVSLHQMRRVNIRPFSSWFDAIEVMPTPLT